MKSRKGISPILATLLLIVIAVAAISVTYAWIMTYMGNTTGKAGASLEKFNVNFASTPSKSIIIDIGNSGTDDATVNAFYVGNSTSTMVAVTPSPATGTVTAGGSPVSFTITGIGWDSGATVYFRVVSSLGTKLEFNERAP